MKFYRSLLRIVQVGIILVILPRVGSFVANLGTNPEGLDFHDIIAAAFAIVLGIGTIGSAYFSDHSDPPEYDEEPGNARERKRREREAVYYATMLQAAPYATRSMLLFAFLDGAFNLAEAMIGASDAGRFIRTPGLTGMDATIDTVVIWTYAIAVVIFGVAPTVLSIVLARLNSMVDRIPLDYEKPVNKKQIDWLRTIMGNMGFAEYSSSNLSKLARGEEEDTPEAPKRASPQTKRIVRVLETALAEGKVLTFSETLDALGEDPPSNSTVSTVRNKWIRFKGLEE